MTLKTPEAESMAQDILDAISAMINTHGERPPGSAGERACQEQLDEELRKAGVQTRLEPFKVSQKAFMAMPLVCSVLTLCALPLYWVAPALALAPVLIAAVVCVCELIFYRHVLTPFFPKHESVNLEAVAPARAERRRRIIIVGHADAAYEWTLLRCFPRIFPFFPILTVLSTVYVLLTTAAATLLGGNPVVPGVWQWLGYSQLLALPGLVIGLCYTNFWRVAPGAGDNLSGALIATRFLQWVHAGKLNLEHTEVVALVTGSEEAGLVGARAYINAHKSELDSIETVVVALDTLAELQHLKVYTRDLNGRVHHDPRVCALIRDAAREACAMELSDGVVTVGASDAAAFTQAGVPAAAICAMDPAPAHYYHNRRDMPEMLEKAALATTLQLLTQLCLRYDQQGLTSTL